MSVMDPCEARLRRYFAFLSNRIFHQASILALNYSSPVMRQDKTFWLIVKKDRILLNLSCSPGDFCIYDDPDWACHWDSINVMQCWYTRRTSDILINQSIILGGDQWCHEATSGHWKVQNSSKVWSYKVFKRAILIKAEKCQNGWDVRLRISLIRNTRQDQWPLSQYHPKLLKL